MAVKIAIKSENETIGSDVDTRDASLLEVSTAIMEMERIKKELLEIDFEAEFEEITKGD